MTTKIDLRPAIRRARVGKRAKLETISSEDVSYFIRPQKLSGTAADQIAAQQIKARELLSAIAKAQVKRKDGSIDEAVLLEKSNTFSAEDIQAARETMRIRVKYGIAELIEERPNDDTATVEANDVDGMPDDIVDQLALSVEAFVEAHNIIAEFNGPLPSAQKTRKS